MKNITLSVDEQVLMAVRRHAVENRLVREFLADIAEREDRASSARQRIRELSDRSAARLGRKSWTRGELYES